MSACAPSDRLLQSLKVKVPGATDDVIKLELFNIVDEFFRRTNAWRQEVSITLDETQREYGLDVPPNGTIVRMLAVGHNGQPVPNAADGSSAVVMSGVGRLPPELTFADGDATFAPAFIQPAGTSFAYAIYTPDYITVTTNPTEEQTRYPMVAVYALSVARGCLECECGDWDVPDWMWDMFFQDWLNGTLAALYGMPMKPWTDDKHAVFHGKKFRNKMAFRSQEARRGFVHGVPAWRFPRGGWT